MIKIFFIIILLFKVQIKAEKKIPFSDVSSEREKAIENVKYHGLLYPHESETREVRSLDGFWDFIAIYDNQPTATYTAKWIEKKFSNSKEVIQMPVPSSFNDITTSAKLRDHVGSVYYARNFFVPNAWKEQRIYITFGSVNYYAQVWVNGRLMKSHKIGHLPFEVEVSENVNYGGTNRIIVGVSNVLRQSSIPQGKVTEANIDNGTAWIQSYTFDFFNYAGIHRPVLLHTRPKVYINDISINTSVSEGVGIIEYIITTSAHNISDEINCTAVLLDGNMKVQTKSSADRLSGVIRVLDPKLWWPRGMNTLPGFMYTLKISISLDNSTITDVYRLPVGIRMLKWTPTGLLFNDKPLYMRGLGRHEDSVLRGRGLDLVTMTRDYELLKWVGANAYRTSHYPYSDEVMDMADRQGFLIINECPATNTENISTLLLTHHKSSLMQLIRRDKNRPSVIMWSISNGLRSQNVSSLDYFKEVAQYTKNLDPTRPITAVLSTGASNTLAKYLDIISFNKYNSWYKNPGRLDMITNNVIEEAITWYKKYKKPVLMSEYGADAISGLHELPEQVWSEEYQTAMFSQYFKAFDKLRNNSWFIGEFIWNFADFRTPQVSDRPGGNKKGIFTRNREPKMAAHHVRKRYHALGLDIDGQQLPDDLDYYITSNPAHS